ncbi:MAG TPA: DedA family protein [Desulfurivibrionaceae bacterium]|nr:DedA family protein [Desulfurivibrionaceae bacterium]
MIASLLELAQQLLHVLLHLDVYVNQWAAAFGVGVYVLLFLIIFAETGLVVTPFLPGDSFLFALGALTAVDDAYLSLPVLIVLLITAALCGDLTNYHIGRYLGPKVFHEETGRLLNRKYLDRTHAFYEKHGGKTIIIARFAPIIRTFAPFVAGVGAMRFTSFISFSVVGAVLWVTGFLSAGHYFGNLPAVKSNFHIVILAIIFVSLLPMFYELFKVWRSKANLA